MYRIESPIVIQNTTNFELEADNVEIISENAGNMFHIFENTNFTLRGPLYLDADPFGFTQVNLKSPSNPKLSGDRVWIRHS